ncbi:hypothetical protein [Streptomyces sp. NPDC058861]|uniref:hypothetical protein n=1 Tax=Streptomyces sp. NPDC058861 TaxID=3346653 RepID=UPI0036B68FE8
MTAPTTPVEQLLALGCDFTRHHDALWATTLLLGPDPAGTLTRHIVLTRSLARDALAISDTLQTMPRLHRSPAVKACVERTIQLSALATLADGHLLNAIDILQEAAQEGERARRGAALLEAGRRTTLAGRLTSLGNKDCLATARLIARELHLQRIGPGHLAPALSPARLTALEAIAAGRVAVNRFLNKPYTDEIQVSISTIRSLEGHGLARHEPSTPSLHEERVHLTPEGCLALAGHFAAALPPGIPACATAPSPYDAKANT